MVSGFRQKKIKSFERVGEILRRERESQEKELSDVAHSIRVRQENLQRLEDGYYNDLPADVYTKGFIKSYAEYLGLSADRLLRLYNKERGIQDHIERDTGGPEANPKPIKPSVMTPRLIKLIAIIAVIAAAVWYLGVQLGNFSKNPHLSIHEPIDSLTLEEDFVTFRGEADKQAELTINGEGVFVNEDGSFEKEISLQEGMNEVAVIISDRRGRSSQLKRQILVEKPEEPEIEEPTEEPSAVPDQDEDLSS
ncbi:helix-turn-helix domain-containing protein [Patescibacteria group bacterium]